MLRHRGIAFKLVVLFSASSACILASIVGLNYAFSRKTLEKSVEESARCLTMGTVYRIESILAAAEKVPGDLACVLESSACSNDSLLRLLESLTAGNREIYGMACAFEPYAYDPAQELYAPYYYKKDGKTVFVPLAAVNGDYATADWYQIPRELGAPYWTEPYFDEGGGNIMMSTYAVPFFERTPSGRQVRGIVTADISLEWLRGIISSIRILDTGYAFLISKNGTIVTHPSAEMIMHETIFSMAEARGDTALRELGRKMIRGESGFGLSKSLMTGKRCWIYYAPVPSTGWSLAVLFPRDEYLAGITTMRDLSILAGVLGIALILLAVFLIARSITRPLRAIAHSAGVIATGNLDAPLPPVHSKDEVGRLTEAFHAMTRSLKDYIARLTETVAVKERIQSELSIARRIQMSILPKKFPTVSDKEGIDIYAMISPAKEVGGDFYDFHHIDKDRICFVIGDVSGKGVPASLFMAVTKTFLKATVSRVDSPEKVLAIVNKELSSTEDQSLFVTVFFGIIDVRTGEVFYTNGGHNSPVIIRKGGEAAFVSPVGGMVMGVMEDASFATGHFVLAPGELLFLYTDGVTEAMNERHEEYTDERMERILERSTALHCKETVEAVFADVKAFTGKASQSDDITMMAIKLEPPHAA